MMKTTAYILDQEFYCLYDNNVWEYIECYLNLPESDCSDQNPLNNTRICEYQQQADKLLAL